MEQEAWNFLFGWITGKQCLLPEGCSIPLSGMLVYGVVAIGVIMIFYCYHNPECRSKLRELWKR